MILGQINGPEEPKALPSEDLKTLTQEIRTFLIEKVSHAGGHLAFNLGVVELTTAFFETLDPSEDEAVWDVGHQFYTHKILNRRIAKSDELCQHRGPSGSPKRKESPYGSFDTDHSSTSVSVGLGIALGRDIRGEDYRMVSVIGDGTFTSGMAHEALNNAARMEKNFVIVLNDNKMSILENAGSMSCYSNGLYTGSGYNDLRKSMTDALDRIPVMGIAMASEVKRTKGSIKQLLIPGMLFENMDITYPGPVDGHNIQVLCEVLREVQKLSHAIPVYVMTRKGKGYRPTEKNPSYPHGVDPSNVKTGKPLSVQTNPSHMDVFSRKLCQLGEGYPELVAITATMPDGMGLVAFRKKFPDRFFGVGIAETYAVTSAAGMAVARPRPVMMVYPSFLQRTYDQVLYDVRIQNPSVFFAVDRAGLMGSDGETHQGIFDYPLLTSIPDASIMAPKNLWELRATLGFAMDCGSPLAIRYPRGEVYRELREPRQPIPYGVREILYEEEDTALPAVGNMASTGEHVRQKLKAEGYRCSPTNGRFTKPFDRKMVPRLVERYRLIVTTKEDAPQDGYGLVVTTFVYENYPEVKVLNIAIPDAHVEHGSVFILREGLGTDNDSIIRTTRTGGHIGQEILEVRPTPDREEVWV